MSINIIAPGGKWIGAPIRSRVRASLLGFFKFGRTIDDSLTNWARGGIDATLIASGSEPTVADGYLGLRSGFCYLRTEIPDTEKFTRLAIFASDDAILGSSTSPVIIGNYSSTPALYGASLFFSSGPNISGSIALGTSETPSLLQVSISGATPSNVRLVSHSFDGVTQKITDHTNNLTASVTTGLARLLSPSKMKIGGADSSFLGKSRIYAAAIFGRALSPTELGYMVDQFRALAAADSVVV